jgi:hypothetical protein
VQVGDTGPAESTRRGNLQRVGLLFLGSRDSDEMASFAVNGNLYSICTEDVIVQTMHSRSFGGKMKNAYYSQWTGVVDFLFLFFSHTGDVFSAMM